MRLNLRARYAKFRAWQQAPFHYANHSDGKVACQNCGTTYDGNFCPICGQKANVSRITWNTLREGVMILWGMDTRSLPYTILQLLLRPGYLISDYLSGRRQVSFPPVKMLFILTIGDWLLSHAKTILGLEEEKAPVEAAPGLSTFFDRFVNWADNNEGWATLLFTGFFILPTWLLFRRAPRHPRHTLPEGFFIQVFMASICEISGILCEIAEPLLILIPLYYFIAYKQLFGYSAWGTFWRVSLCMAAVVILIIAVFVMAASAFIIKQVS